LLLFAALARPEVGASSPRVDEPAPAFVSPEEPELLVSVPIGTDHGHIDIQVTIGGNGPFRFQVDTGSGYAVTIDKTLVQKLGLEEVATTLNSDGRGKAVKKPVVQLEGLALGGYALGAQRAMVDDYSWIDPERPVMGLLGLPVFRGAVTHIDYPNGVLELTRGELNRSDPETLRYTASRGIPSIRIKVGKRSLRAVLDSGAEGALVLPLSFMKGLCTEAPPVVIGRATTANSTSDVLGAKLVDPLFVGTAKIEEVDVYFMQLDFAVVGPGVLDRFRMSFDPANKLVRLAVPKPVKKAPSAD
jgi:predicted aspartyl protease